MTFWTESIGVRRGEWHRALELERKVELFLCNPIYRYPKRLQIQDGEVRFVLGREYCLDELQLGGLSSSRYLESRGDSIKACSSNGRRARSLQIRHGRLLRPILVIAYVSHEV